MARAPSLPGPETTVLITGCSSGIGYCAAQGLRRRGYRVLATARRPEDVSRLAAEGLESLQLDLDDSESIRRTVNEVLTRTGDRVYALFNNAGYGQPGAVEDLSRAAVRAQFETNLFGGLELTNLLIPAMRRQGQGRIIQNSSVLGLVALPFRGAYNAAKFALEGLSDTLRQELQGSGIQVSLIEPGPIESRFRANALKALRREIDMEVSVHSQRYQRMVERLQRTGPVAPFTAAPDAVLKRLIHALESRRARPRYYVTPPTHLLGHSRRILSTRAMDRLARWLSRQEEG